MINLSNSKTFDLITKLLILLAAAKSISLALWWLLPSEGVELQVKENYKPEYKKVDFNNMLESVDKHQKKIAKDQPSGISITNMVLKGLYGKDSKGFAIVALKSSQDKTTIVPVGGEFSGYTLKSILSNGIVFVKAGKEYILEIKSSSNNSFILPVENDSATKNISRNDIEYYWKDPQNIWRDISIVEVKKADKIIGFEVTKVAEKSMMETLGLKKGDIIIRANNVELKSYKDALDIYNKIDMLDTLQIVIMRNNQEKELIYEIN